MAAVTDTTDVVAQIKAFADEASRVTPHRFTVITALDDGSEIPPEALSDDHSVGLYGAIIPYKMKSASWCVADTGRVCA